MQMLLGISEETVPYLYLETILELFKWSEKNANFFQKKLAQMEL